MSNLVITQEYKFEKGGSYFYITEGNNLKVKLADGSVITGTLLSVSFGLSSFDILDTETGRGNVIVYCEEVIDIIPL